MIAVRISLGLPGSNAILSGLEEEEQLLDLEREPEPPERELEELARALELELPERLLLSADCPPTRGVDPCLLVVDSVIRAGYSAF